MKLGGSNTLVSLVIGLVLFFHPGPGTGAAHPHREPETPSSRGQHKPLNTVAPPLADPRTPFNHLKFFAFEDNDEEESLLGAEAALTHNVGFERWTGEDGTHYQLTCAAGVFSQFQESINDFELVSSDFFVGIPLEIRTGNHGIRGEVYHLSSHLGDEFQERTNRDRISFSHESLRLDYFWYGLPHTRFYVEYQYALRIDPDVDRNIAGGGFDYQHGPWLVALDSKFKQRNDWEPATNLQIIRKTGIGSLQAGLEFFDGPLPVGQFFRDERTYAGLVFRFRD